MAKAKSDNYGLLIAALVAIVAIVGLVILFSSRGTVGAVSNPSAQCPPGQALMMVEYPGGVYVQECASSVPYPGGSYPGGGAPGSYRVLAGELAEQVDPWTRFSEPDYRALEQGAAI